MTRRAVLAVVAFVPAVLFTACAGGNSSVRPTADEKPAATASAPKPNACGPDTPYLVGDTCVACRSASDCKSGERCDAGACVSAGIAGSGWGVTACTTDDQCGPGGRCDNGLCQPISPVACRLESVHFELDSSQIDESAAAVLRRNADCLKLGGAPFLLVEGHCDERGSTRYNYDLGESRAQKVQRYLADLGVTARIDTISFGKDRPKVSHAQSEEQHQANRRAEFRVRDEPRSDKQIAKVEAAN